MADWYDSLCAKNSQRMLKKIHLENRIWLTSRTLFGKKNERKLKILVEECNSYWCLENKIEEKEKLSHISFINFKQ